MFSQNNIFSQGGELSQLNLSLPGQNNDKNNEQINTCNRNDIHESNVSHYSQHENAGNVMGYQPDRPEEPLSSRADAICEENRQMIHFVESNLKQFDKKRIKLTNTLNELEKEEIRLLEIHNHRSQQLLQLQMGLEEFTENYQNALDQWPKVTDKVQRTELLIEVFMKHYDEGVNLGEDVEKALQHLTSLFEENRAEENTIKERKRKMKTSFDVESEEIIQKCQDLRKSILEKRATSIGEIQTLAFSIDQNSHKNNQMEEQINQCVNNKKELTNKSSNLTIENKSLNEEIVKLHQQLNEFRSVSALDIQNLKLRSNTQENIISNLELKSKEKENSLNNISTKYMESVNLSNQMKIASQEKLKCNQKQLKKVEDFQEQKKTLSEQTESLSESIKHYDNAERESILINTKICTLEKNIKQNDESIIEKKGIVENLKNRVEDSKEVLDNIEINLSQLKNELKLLKFKEDENTAKLKEEDLLYQQERASKMLRNEIMEQANLDVASKLNKLSSDFKEFQVENELLQREMDELKHFIKKLSTNSMESKEKLLVAKSDWAKKCTIFSEKELLTNEELEEYEDLLVKLKPEQQELLALREEKSCFESEIDKQNQKFQKDKDVYEKSFNSKILELERDKENHSLIMIRLLTAEKEAKEKRKEEIKLTEKTKMKHIEELKRIHQQLGSIRREEENKRIKVAKMDKKMQTINKQIKVTQQDISDAITGNVEKPKKPKSSTKLMTPTSSVDSILIQDNPPSSKLSKTKDSDFMSNILSQENTKKMVEFVPYDEYDFTEL